MRLRRAKGRTSDQGLASRGAAVGSASAEEARLLTLALKEPGRYVEGVLLSEKCPPALLRFVLPPLALALAQTEGEEKNHRLRLMQERRLTELEAALVVAEEMGARRRRYALLESLEAP